MKDGAKDFHFQIIMKVTTSLRTIEVEIRNELKYISEYIRYEDIKL